MTVRFRANLDASIQALGTIGEAMVRAVAIQTVNDAKLKTRGGFKSGRFVTTGWNKITWKVDNPGGIAPVATVGHSDKHWAFWELGHHNAFTGQYERVEWLRPAMDEKRVVKTEVARRAAKQAAEKVGASINLKNIKIPKPSLSGPSGQLPG